eukprot:TRINITY_DN42323_c0_g1_i1.p1 TRINITY_DN42323_c0_g1~~TRINITY_DN42323_c0_g1_i1.p1  ORF type:complete len:345 (+),score=59.87 TRINITY_DN42323_c0_g1_i1:46-1080(+)
MLQLRSGAMLISPLSRICLPKTQVALSQPVHARFLTLFRNRAGPFASSAQQTQWLGMQPSWQRAAACLMGVPGALLAVNVLANNGIQKRCHMSSTKCEAPCSQGLVIVVGVSHVPGIGFAVAKRFAAEGMTVGLIGRQSGCLADASAQIRGAVPNAQVETAVADATNRDDIQAAIHSIEKKYGSTEVLIYNVSARPMPATEVTDTTPERYLDMFNTNLMGAVHCTQAVLPTMKEKKHGTIIFTGASASWRGSAKFSAFAAAKMALRGFAQSLAKEASPLGVHVAHVVIDGMVDMPLIHKFVGKPEGRMIDTDAIADTYWLLHSQKPHCFTFELDVRPNAATWAI